MQKSTYQVPITYPYLPHYIICHLPLVFLSPQFTLAVLFALSLSSLSFSICPFLSASFLFACVLVRLLVTMAPPKFGDLHLKRLEEIESNVRSFMALQFEHNSFFRNELKEQKSFTSFMNKELDDMSK